MKYIITANRYIQIFSTGVILIILPIMVFALLTSNIEIAGIRSFVVLTGSMQPTIPQGAISFTMKENNYKQEDIITFAIEGGQLVTHRIVESQIINGVAAFKTQGDANNVIDSETVALSDVVGRTLFYIPYVGKFILMLKTLPGFLSFVILPGILFILIELWNVKKEMEKEIEKKLKVQSGEFKITI